MTLPSLISSLLLLTATAIPAIGASAAYSFTGVTSDGRTLTFQYNAPAPITASTVLTPPQISCAPACDSVAVFPNAQMQYDLLVFDIRNSGGLPTSVSFYFPYGAFAAPGDYSTVVISGVQSSGSLTVQQTGVPGITAPAALPNGVSNLAYSQVITASGGTSPYVFSLDQGALPAGLTLASNGLLSGIPTAPGSYSFSVKVTDAASAFSSRSFSVNIASGVTIATATLPNATSGLVYNQTLTANGGTGPYTWSLAAGALPPGLSLASTGIITGITTTGGAYNFTARVTDSAAATATRTFTIAVASVVTITANSALPNGSVGAPYLQNLGAVGGAAPYSWTLISTALPAGLTLSPNGTLSGTPTASTNSSFALRVADAAGTTAIQNFTLFIGSGVIITSTSPLPGGVIGTAYSQTLTATGGTAPYTWTLSGGALPAGLTLSPTGVISGTPTAAGASIFAIQAADSASGSNVATFTLTITPAVTISTASSLPGGLPGIAYSQTLAATGGVAPYSWAVTAGAVPPGLTLSTSGSITGTPTSGGAYNFVVRATDSVTGFALQSFNLSIGAALTISTAPTLPNGLAGVPYSQTLTATGGTAPYIWTIAAGSFPPGLTLSPSGAISGTPTTAGAYTFQARVTDSGSLSTTQTFTLTIGSGLAIATASTLPNGVPGVVYSQTLLAVGGAPPYAWTLIGSLPAGLNLSANGTISGTPTTVGASSFQIRVTDNAAAAATQNFTITIGTGVTITTSSPLPNAALGSLYSQTLAAAGGTPPYTWTISGGTVPPGLTLINGVLSGTPTTPGSYLFEVRATDSAAASTTRTFSLTVAAGLAITTTSPLPNGSVGVPYSQALAATGGTAPYLWSLNSGSMPTGLTISNNGVISGTPTIAGSYTFSIRVSDSSASSATANFTITIGAGVSITTTSLPNASTGVLYSQTLAATGGTQPYIWGLNSGSLPPGLSITNNGVISGTPTTIGTYSFSIRVTDSTAVSATQSLTITVNAAVTITTPSPLIGGSINILYSQNLQATGGTQPYTWAISAGTPPPGLILLPTGVLSGTPTTGGTYNFTVRVTDSVNSTATQAYSLTIISGVVITTTSPLQEGSVGSSYFLTFGASGGTGPYNWTVFSGSLPPGLSLSTGGALTGIPSTVGTYNFTIRLADAAGISTTAPFTLVVSSGTTAPRVGVISQIASGGGWKTTISLLNPGTVPAAVRVNLVAEDGAPLVLPITVTSAGSALTLSAAAVDRIIAPNATLIIETDAPISTTAVGWADIRSAVPLSGYAIFRQRHGNGNESEGTSILETRIQSSVLVPFDNTNDFSTGVALVNLSADPQSTMIAIMRDENGIEIARDIVQLAGNGHTSFALPVRFPIIRGRRGFIEFQNAQSAGVTALGLRFNPTLNFTNVPVALRP